MNGKSLLREWIFSEFRARWESRAGKFRYDIKNREGAAMANKMLQMPTAECMAGSRWIRDHLNELVLKYPNQWVAVYAGRVVGANADLEEAATLAEKSSPAEGIAYHFVDDGTLIFQLA